MREDSVHQMYEVRPFGKIETFWVSADVVGSERPQGRAADISRARALIKNSSARIEEFIEELQNTAGLASLAEAITRNAPEVTVALANLNIQGIDFSGELQKIEAAYKIIKDAPYHYEGQVIGAQTRIAEGNLILAEAVEKAYRRLIKDSGINTSN